MESIRCVECNKIFFKVEKKIGPYHEYPAECLDCYGRIYPRLLAREIKSRKATIKRYGSLVVPVDKEHHLKFMRQLGEYIRREKAVQRANLKKT